MVLRMACGPFLRGRVSYPAGYRVLQRGADVDEVYNFALINYIVLGVNASF
jgi:hypothetical protein